MKDEKKKKKNPTDSKISAIIGGKKGPGTLMTGR
jgi:hypothetical protein